MQRRKSDSEKIADKLVKLFGDGTILPHDWKFNVPMYVVHHNFPILRNAKNFIDGLNYHMELYDREVPSDYLVPDFPAVGDDDPIKVFEYERNLFLEKEYDRVQDNNQGEI
jgi:hypothetical protein